MLQPALKDGLDEFVALSSRRRKPATGTPSSYSSSVFSGGVPSPPTHASGSGHDCMIVDIGEMRQYPAATAILLPEHSPTFAGQLTHAVVGPLYASEYEPTGQFLHWLPDKISPWTQSRNFNVSVVFRLYWPPSPDSCAVKARVRLPVG